MFYNAYLQLPVLALRFTKGYLKDLLFCKYLKYV